MISRVYRGSKVYGLLRYLFADGRRNEHLNPRLVASWDDFAAGIAPQWDDVAGRFRVGRLAAQLEQPVTTCARHPAQYVYHLVLRNHDHDRVVSDSEWAEVAAAAMARTGLAPHRDEAGCRWVAVRHDDTHVHVVATLARQDGRPPRHHNDFVQLREVCREYEQRWGLTVTAGGDKTANLRAGVRETVTAERQGRAVLPRSELRRQVRAAASSTAGWREFVDTLSTQNVRVWPRYSTVNPDQLTGYSVSLAGHTDAAGNPIRFGGGKLAPDLTLPKLQARWGVASTGQERRGRRRIQHFPANGPQQSTTAPNLTDEDRDRVWREAERIVQEAADRIRADATSNPDAAADAAWAAGDTLTSTAAAAEGDRGGPLTDAAEAFDRAGADLYGRIPQRSDTGQMLRAAGRMIAMLAAGSRNTEAHAAALVVALTALAAAVADLREAQQRAHQAAAARLAADRLRHVTRPTAATLGGLRDGATHHAPPAPPRSWPPRPTTRTGSCAAKPAARPRRAEPGHQPGRTTQPRGTRAAGEG